MTATELKKRAIALAEKTKIDSVTPEEVGQLSNDIVEYIENVEINGSSLGIRKTYTSVSAMEADSTAPKDDKGVLLRRGMLVNIYNQEDPDSADNGKVFSFQNPGWAFRGTVDAGYATKEELTELDILKSVQMFGIIPISYPNKDKYWNNGVLTTFNGYNASNEIDISVFAGKNFSTTGRQSLLYSYVKKSGGEIVSLKSLCTNYISKKEAVNYGIFPADAEKLLMTYNSSEEPSLVFVPNTEILLDNSYFIKGKYISPSNGSQISNSNYKCTKILPIKAFDTITFTPYSAQSDIAFIAVFDISGKFIKAYNGGEQEDSKTFNISDILLEYESARYFTISCNLSVLVNGVISINSIFNNISELCNLNVEQAELVNSFSNNVFEKPRYINTYLSPNSESLITGYDRFNIFGYVSTDLLTDDNPIIINNFSKRSDTARLRLFDKNLSFIMNHVMNEGSGTVEITGEFIKSLDSRAKYVLVQQNPGETITYKTSLKNLYIEPYVDVELYGKTYIAIGDSITQGISQGQYSGKSYSDLVAQKYNMTYLNNGLGGTGVRIGFKDNSMMIAFVSEDDIVIDAQEVSFLDKSDSYWKFTTPKGCKKIKMTSKYLSSFDNTDNIVITKGDVIGSNIQLETKNGYVKQFGDIQSDAINEYIEASVDESSLYTMSIPNVPIINDTSSYVGRFKSVIQDFLKENPDEEPFITIYGGTNDQHGLLTEGTQGTIDMFNVHTFYGAFNYILKGIYDMLPKVRLGVFTINNPIWSQYPYEENMEANNKVNETIRNVCAKWSTPVLDLAKESGVPTKGLMSDSSYEILCPDGVHFNKFSHIKVSRKVAQFLKSL